MFSLSTAKAVSVRSIVVLSLLVPFTSTAIPAAENSTPNPDYNAITGYGEPLYRDADLSSDDENSPIDHEKKFAADYRRARMAFLFGEYELAYKIWHPQAEDGYDKAQATIGWMYQTGKGVKKNVNTAFDWYSKAARQNHVVAENNLGVFYEQGLGNVQKNMKKAADWYRESAELGYPYAQYNLGILYMKGAGVSKNINEAIYWLQIASLQGVKQAQEELNKISHVVDKNSDANGPSHKPSWVRHTQDGQHSATNPNSDLKTP